MIQKLAVRIQELRQEKGVSSNVLAAMLEVAPCTMSAFEAGTRRPNAERIIKLAELLEVSSDYLLGITDNRN